MPTTIVKIQKTVTYVANLEVNVGADGVVDPEGKMQETFNRLNKSSYDPPLKWKFAGVNYDEAFPADIHP